MFCNRTEKLQSSSALRQAFWTEKMKKYVLDKEKRSLLLTLISGIALLFSFFEQWGPFPVDPAWIAIILCGFPILKAAITGLASRFSIKSSTLISIALVAAIYIG